MNTWANWYQEGVDRENEINEMISRYGFDRWYKEIYPQLQSEETSKAFIEQVLDAIETDPYRLLIGDIHKWISENEERFKNLKPREVATLWDALE